MGIRRLTFRRSSGILGAPKLGRGRPLLQRSPIVSAETAPASVALRIAGNQLLLSRAERGRRLDLHLRREINKARFGRENSLEIIMLQLSVQKNLMPLSFLQDVSHTRQSSRMQFSFQAPVVFLCLKTRGSQGAKRNVCVGGTTLLKRMPVFGGF